MPKIEPRICGLVRCHARKSDACTRAINIPLSPELTRRFGRIQGVFSAPTTPKTADAVVAHLEDAFVRGALEAERRRGPNTPQETLIEDAIAITNKAIARIFGKNGLPLDPQHCVSAIMAVRTSDVIVAVWGAPELVLYRFPESGRSRSFNLLSDQAEDLGPDKTGFTSIITGELQPGDKLLCSTRSVKNLIGPDMTERALRQDPGSAIEYIRESLSEVNETAAIAMLVADVTEFRFIEEANHADTLSQITAEHHNRAAGIESIRNEVVASSVMGSIGKTLKTASWGFKEAAVAGSDKLMRLWREMREAQQKVIADDEMPPFDDAAARLRDEPKEGLIESGTLNEQEIDTDYRDDTDFSDEQEKRVEPDNEEPGAAPSSERADASVEQFEAEPEQPTINGQTTSEENPSPSPEETEVHAEELISPISHRTTAIDSEPLETNETLEDVAPLSVEMDEPETFTSDAEYLSGIGITSWIKDHEMAPDDDGGEQEPESPNQVKVIRWHENYRIVIGHGWAFYEHARRHVISRLPVRNQGEDLPARGFEPTEGDKQADNPPESTPDGLATVTFPAKLRGKFSLTQIIGGALITLLIVITIGALIANSIISGKADLDQERTATFQEIAKKIDSAEASMIYKDDERARTLLAEAYARLESLMPTTEEETSRREQLALRIAGELAELRREVTLAEPVWESTTEARIKLMTLSDDDVWVVGDNGDVTLIDRETENLATVAHAPGDTAPDALLPYGDGVLLVSADSRPLLANSDGVTQSLNAATNDTVTDARLFGSRLYYLDAAHNRILRHVAVTGGWSAAQHYLKDGTDLSNAVSMIIDGSIYVLNSDGSVTKLHQGKKADFSVQLPDPSEVNAVRLRSPADSDYLYVLDSSAGRIIMYEKLTGDLVVQYRSDNLVGAADFVISDDENAVTAAAGNAIFRFDLPQL